MFRADVIILTEAIRRHFMGSLLVRDLVFPAFATAVCRKRSISLFLSRDEIRFPTVFIYQFSRAMLGTR